MDPKIRASIARTKKLLKSGRVREAQALCDDIVAKHAGDVGVLEAATDLYLAMGRDDLAVRVLDHLTTMAPKKTAYHRRRGDLYMHHGYEVQAIDAFQAAVLGDAPTTDDKVKFGMAAQTIELSDDLPDTTLATIRQAVEICLADDHVVHQQLAGLWTPLLLSDRAVAALLTRLQNAEDASFAADQDELRTWLDQPFLLLGLRRLIVPNADFESLMTLLRHSFLKRSDSDLGEYLPFLCALAAQCDLNEYVYLSTDDEQKRVAELVNALPGSTPDAAEMARIALIASYQRLVGLPDAGVILEVGRTVSNPLFQDLLNAQINEPLVLREAKQSIRSVSAIQDEVSSSVRAQYEENPYPRWRYLGSRTLTKEQIRAGRGKSILVAGCGTGQEISANALVFPQAQLTGIDLSLASLAYGKTRSEDLRIGNIDFIHADILDADKLGQQFDYVSSCGVLHHMEDPAAGWRKLIECLAPDGVMKIALYSEIARDIVVRCRDFIEENGFAATPDGIRAFRQAVLDLDDTHPVKPVSQWMDFYSLSMCRDLVFHVQEHRFTWLQVKDVLASLGLELVKIDTPPAIDRRYRDAFPGDASALNLDNWHAFEVQNPATFAGMYTFWCCRSTEALSQIPPWIRRAWGDIGATGPS